MKKAKIVSISLFTMLGLLMLVSSSAMAYPVFEICELNELFFENVENIYSVDNGVLTLKDPDAFGSVMEEGDVFQGIMKIQNIKVNGLDIWEADNISPGIDSFTGYFLLEVDTITVDAFGPDLIGFKAFTNADPAGRLDTTQNEVMALYTDTTTGYETNGTVSQDIDVATDGLLWGTLGLGTGETYWYSFAEKDFSTIYQNTIAEGFGGLDFVQNNTGMPWGIVNDPNEGLENGDVQFYFQTEIERTEAGVADYWDFLSNDPAKGHPVPEPATMLLLGSGLIGLAGWGRKKRFSKKD